MVSRLGDDRELSRGLFCHQVWVDRLRVMPWLVLVVQNICLRIAGHSLIARAAIRSLVPLDPGGGVS